jgi:sulfite reductase (NADPH) flavoprotein alpha-component
MLSDARLYAACTVALLYVAGSVYSMWIAPRKRSKAASIDRHSSSLLVVFASQTGFADQLADQTARMLSSAGAQVGLLSLSNLEPDALARAQQALFIVSTTGEGDAPDLAATFLRRTLSTSQVLANLRYAVLALGDRKYANFCAFGHRLDTWLRHQGATPLWDVTEVDNGDMAALRHWQHQLSVLTQSPDLPDWESPVYERWRLTKRVLLNPHSVGPPCFHIELQASNRGERWQAGDIVEIDPRNSTWNSPSTPLPHREYSIGSLPEDGAIHLLVREMRRSDGTSGLGSGWLINAPLDSDIAARIRTNRNFHPPEDARPLILIGNGTGIAGLRGLIKARIASKRTRNWLIFGERNRGADNFYADDLERWQREASLVKVDLVFSRDQAEKRYVQHALSEQAHEVRRWVDEGAAIYVCGSLEGMAPAVHHALERILGQEFLERLAAEGRYRRDVY